MARKSSWLEFGHPGQHGYGQPGAAQEVPGAAQEHPGVARRRSWLDLGILYPGRLTGGSHEPGSWGGGRAARSSPGSSSSSTWLDLGILANMAEGSQEQSRKLQEQPQSTQEWPGGAPGMIWGLLANMSNMCPRLGQGFREEGTYINTLTCVRGKGDALYYVVWAVGLNPSLTLS